MTQRNPIVPVRRLIAAGFIRRRTGRMLTLHATETRVTGALTKTACVAELHKLCREDYESAAPRRDQNHRDDAHLIAPASKAVNG